MMLASVVDVDMELIDTLLAKAPSICTYLSDLMEEDVTSEIANVITNVVLYTNH